MPNTDPTPADPSNTTLSREDVVRLGRGGKPWEFLPVAAAALAIAPGDHGVRFLAAASLARLGLKTLAAEMLEALPEAVTDHPDIRALQAALSALPSDRVTLETREHTLVANLTALEARGPAPLLREAIPQWRGVAKGFDIFRTLDGNVIRRALGSPRGELRVLAWLRDDRGRARQPVATFLRPIVIEGIDPPWTLLETAAASSHDPTGFRPRIFVVQAEPAEFLEGLSIAPLADTLREERVECLVGPQAGEALEARLSADLGVTLPDSVMVSQGTRRRLDPEVVSHLRQVIIRQETEYEELGKRAAEAYRHRDLPWWRARYDAAESGEGPPLRVLFQTTRHSTYIRHAAHGLAEGFRRRGASVLVLEETTPHERLCAVARLRALLEFDPDLVVLINYTRLGQGGVFPENIPVISWLQDAMPHLFNPQEGARQGPLDFVAGYTFPELFTDFGFPRARALSCAIAADPGVFAPVPGAPRVCDVLAVTHHGQTPEALHEEIVSRTSDALIRDVFERLKPDVHAAAGRVSVEGPMRALARAVETRLREIGAVNVPTRTKTLVLRTYAAPMADRILRHQTLRWASSIAQRRGWTFHLHGKGWERHPELSRHARGPLEHGEALRAAYQGARANLHVTVHALIHQRVVECALSGGVSLVRFHREALDDARVTCMEALLEREPDVREPGRVGYAIADHPPAMHEARLRTLTGDAPTEPMIWIDDDEARALRSRGRPAALEFDADWTLRDLPAFAFHDEAGLEALLERAIELDEWRDQASRMQRTRCLSHLTHDALAQRFVRLVRGGLGGVTSCNPGG